jgi:hypothetical protein
MLQGGKVFMDPEKFMKAKLTLTMPYELYRIRQLMAKFLAGIATEDEKKELMELLKPKPIDRLEDTVIGVRLTSQDNKPIVDAEVKFTVAGESQAIKTDATGLANVHIQGMQTKNITLTAKAKGYKEFIIKNMQPEPTPW